jgi:dethiobiotin synthetase
VSVFVTGTDTAAGKTTFVVWLLERLRSRGMQCAGYKPICCGDREDARRLLEASTCGLTIDEVNPCWLKTPAAPLAASLAEDCEIDLEALREGFVRLEDRVEFVVVEGVGGWMVPITRSYFTNDLATDLDLPVIVVAPNRLGCLNHILLTVRSVTEAGLSCAGVVLNQLVPAEDVATRTNAETLARCLTMPILGRFDPKAVTIGPEIGQMLAQIGGD